MIRRDTLNAFLERFKRSARYYVHGLYQEIANKNLFLWAQAIAFKVLVTIVPVVVLAAGIVGQVMRSSQPFAQLAEVVRDFLPPSQSEQILRFLEQLYTASGTLTLFGALGLFLSAWSLFITLRIAVSNAFEQDWHVGRSIIGGYLFDVRMVLQVGLLFTLTIGLSIFAQSLGSVTFVEWIGLDARRSHRRAADAVSDYDGDVLPATVFRAQAAPPQAERSYRHVHHRRAVGRCQAGVHVLRYVRRPL